jgi:hypothetical protein
VKLCQSIELLDAKGKFTGAFVRDTSVEGILSAPMQVHFSCTKPATFAAVIVFPRQVTRIPAN